MNVAKNWALTIILIALTLKEQMIIPVKKTLNDAKIESILAKFAKKKSSEIGCFLLIVSRRSFFPKSPVKSADFLQICPWESFEISIFALKSREIGRFLSEFCLFYRENPAKSADFSANLPLKIPRNFDFFSAKYQKPRIIYCWYTGLHLCAENQHEGRYLLYVKEKSHVSNL